MTITLWIVSTLFVFALILGPHVFAWRARQLDMMLQCQHEFFSTARKLIDEPDTPEPVIKRLDILAHNMGTAASIRAVFWAALNGDLRRFADNPPADFKEFIEAARGMRSELQDLLSRAIGASLFAASFKSIFFGTLIRRVLLFAVKKSKDQATYVAAGLPENNFHHDGNHAHA